MRNTVTALLLVCGIGVGVPARAQDDNVSKLAGELATLRAEVDRLSSDIEAKKEAQRATLRSLAAQKMDVELGVTRQERQVEQLHENLTKRRAEVAQASGATADLKPALLASIGELRGVVAQSLPFKTRERLTALDEIEAGLNGGTVTPEKTTSRLWQFVEDELRLTRENGIYPQTIALGQDELLVDVARLGMVAIYFRASDGRVGFATHENGAWSWRELSQPEHVAQVHTLFDSLKKQIRSGYFELPLAFVGGLR